jgi:hypothetical protein
MSHNLPMMDGFTIKNVGTAAQRLNAPQPPDSRKFGASDQEPPRDPASQSAAPQDVAPNSSDAAASQMHHDAALAGDTGARLADESAVKARLTAEELARFLTYVECGYSLRQAAAAIGRAHTTLLRLRNRCRAFARELRQRQELAREQPLRHLRESSQRSWRAAAWLLNYLDAQQRPPRRRPRKTGANASVKSHEPAPRGGGTLGRPAKHPPDASVK